MVWADAPFAHRVEFSAGSPTGAVSYRVLGPDGTELLADDVYPLSGAVDVLLVVPAEFNTCAAPLFEIRTLMWSYLTATGAQSGREIYHVNKPLPFAATADGVRNKLGLSDHEIDDSAIDLVLAYSDFAEKAPNTDLIAVANAGDRSTLLALHAIEATAALHLLPTIQLRASQHESSGTNKFSRFTKIDWEMLEAALNGHIGRALETIDTTYETGAGGFIFGTAPRETDAFTGEAYE